MQVHFFVVICLYNLISKACLNSQAGHALTINKSLMSGYDLMINQKEIFYKMSFDVELVLQTACLFRYCVC
jgi:hypothetical protein